MILIEHGPQGQPVMFDDPLEVITAFSVQDVVPALERAEAARLAGAWVAGYLAYEAGYAFEERLEPLPLGEGPLLVLGVFRGPQALPADLASKKQAYSTMAAPVPVVGFEDYQDNINRVLDYIAAGDCYQVNLTFPLESRLLEGNAFGLYTALRSSGPMGHGAFVDLGVGPVLVSHSPELFFRLDGNGMIEARPMKGTRPRDADPVKDAALAADLAASEKDRAENLMIVDLLRNDISRLSKVGSVKVPKLFAVEHYPTVHQMTSTIVGEIASRASLLGLMRALFPCGSITGAPKIRAMQIIAELEGKARGAYCGAIGWMSPEGAADFSVAIRTLAIEGDRILMNVGGGIVRDSTALGEWEEALWKTRFVNVVVKKG